MMVMADFTWSSGLAFLILKISAKGILKWLADNPAKAVVLESSQSIGMDLGLLGLSILVGGVASSRIVISGQENALSLLALFAFALLSMLAFGACLKTKTAGGYWFWVTSSWICGLCPFGLATHFLFLGVTHVAK